MKIRGEAVYVNAEGTSHEIKGVGIISDSSALQKMKISGELSFDEISCDSIIVEGKCEGGSLMAKIFSVEGKAEIDSVKVAQTFELEGKPELGNVEADEIIIESCAGSINEIKCRRLKIFNRSNSVNMIAFTKVFGKKIFNEEISVSNEIPRVRVKNIDADTVELENCEIDVIRCKNALIGSNCAIEKLFVSGNCKVADDSKVGETIRE